MSRPRRALCASGLAGLRGVAAPRSTAAVAARRLLPAERAAPAGLHGAARLRSVARLRYCAPGEWGHVLGLARIPEMRTRRAVPSAISRRPLAMALRDRPQARRTCHTPRSGLRWRPSDAASAHPRAPRRRRISAGVWWPFSCPRIILPPVTTCRLHLLPPPKCGAGPDLAGRRRRHAHVACESPRAAGGGESFGRAVAGYVGGPGGERCDGDQHTQ